MVEEMYVQEAKDESEEPNGDQPATASATAQIPTSHPTTTTTTTAVTHAKRSEINVHENDPSFVSFNTSETHPLPTSSAAAPTAAMHDTEACRKQPAGIRFVTSSGDVSLTLGLRHAGNVPEKSSFSVREFDSC